MKNCLPMAALTLALFANAAQAGSELSVESGSTHIITVEEQDMSLDRLVLGDDSRLVFADGVSYWNLIAEQATIGKRVVINASGRDGQQGASAEAIVPAQAKSCEKGEKGSTGGAGTDGTDAVDLSLQMSVVSLGSLEVMSDGGSGGNGGNGSQGQHAGDSSNRCTESRGGTGGSGGKGGKGGDAGNVSISLSSKGSLSLPQVSHQINVSAEAGQGGLGGKPGVGGKGSPGHYKQKKTLNGNKKWVEGGRSGLPGAVGDRGGDGRNGRVYVGSQAGALSLHTPPVAAQNLDYSSTPLPKASSEVESLRQQLEMMQKRLDALDKK